MIGKTVSHYRVIRSLGHGGMGEVFEAEDITLKRHVALKVLSNQEISQESRERFIREAQAASALNHPNIAMVYDFLELDTGDVIVMEFIAGPTLKALLSEGTLSEQEVARIGMQACSALAEAHKKGLVHRDIKPENLMLSEKGELKITDFGCVKLLSPLTAERTQVGTTLGTLSYMSPEQVQGLEVDGRSDLFSLGAVLYELLTGKPPFAGEYAASVVYSIVHEEPQSLHELRPEIPERLEHLIRKALDKDKGARYDTADAMASELEALQGGGVGSVAPGAASTKRAATSRWVVALAAVLLIGLLATFFLQKNAGTGRKASLVVMPFEIATSEEDWQWLGEALPDLLSKDLAQESSLRILSAQRRTSIAHSLGFQHALLSQAEALQVAREGKAGKLILGNVNKKGDTITVYSSLFNTETGESLDGLKPVTGSVGNLYELVDELSANLMRVLELGFAAELTNRKVATITTSSMDAYRYYLEGKDAALDMRHQESIKKLTQAIKLDSTFIEPYYYLAWQYRVIGNSVKAKETLTRGKPFIAHLSEEAKLDYLGHEAKNDRRWHDYAAYLEKLIQIDPSSAAYLYGYGRTQYYFFRRLDSGIAAMEKALQLDPTYTYAYNTLGYAYLSKGDKARAFEMIDKYVALNPADFNPLDSKAELQVFVGQYDEAIANCERILAVHPDFQSAVNNLARSYAALGRYARGLQVLSDYLAVEKNPQFISIGKTTAAEIHLLQGNTDAATRLTTQAIEADSTNMQARWVRARVGLRLDDKNAVMQELAALQHNLALQESLEDMWYVYYLRGAMAVRDGDFHGAVAVFTGALSLGPLDRSFYLTALANARAQSGQLQMAVKLYQEALAFNPNNALTLIDLARTQELLGERSEAIRQYRRIIDIWSEADAGLPAYEMVKSSVAALTASTQK